MARSSSASASTAARGLSSPLTRLAAGAVLVVGGILASAGMNAQADTKPATPAGVQKVAHAKGHEGARGEHAHRGHHARHGRHGGHHGAAGNVLDPRRLDRLLDEVKATDAQRAQIRQISGAARDDLRKLHEGGKPRAQFVNPLAQPKIDAAAAEAARQQQLARQDAVSKRVLTATLDVAKVLTPEQRTQLAEKAKKRQERFEQRRAQRSQPGGERQ